MVEKTVYTRSGKNMPIGHPKRILDRERVMELRRRGASIRAVPSGQGWERGPGRYWSAPRDSNFHKQRRT